ncbi:MAG: rhodanese-like domain-containing protein [Ardenticatenaceae bacterium]|nr:rhodanese-like domain-containing protein [Ardenticatenaceae bacterium]
MNPYGVPEVTPLELAQKRENQEAFVLLDVREANELALASLENGYIHLPLSELAQRHLEAIPEALTADKDQEVLVLCHHGNRSAQVCAYLKANGWSNVLNVAGGIHQYALQVDSDVGMY